MPFTIWRRILTFVGVASLALCASEAPAADPAATPPAAKASSHPARAKVESLAKSVAGWGGQLGAMAIELDTGTVLFQSGEHQPLNPASNAKLWTAAAALRRLGAEHRFVTGLYGKVEGTTVDPLVLRGLGDPDLRTADLADLARRLVALGVTRVGTVGVDQSHFDDRHVPPAFEQQPNEWAAFRAPVAAVSVERNSITFTVVPRKAGEAALVTVEPAGFAHLSGRVDTGRRKTSEIVKIDATAGEDKRLDVRLEGAIPEGSPPADYPRRIEDPTLYAGFVLKEQLVRAGIEVTGEVTARKARPGDLLAAHRSAPVSEILARLGKDSDNFTAEMLLKALGAEEGSAGSSKEGARVVAETLEQLGALDEGTEVQNGSGLFDANRATAHGIATLLAEVWKDSRLRTDYVAHLSVAGVDGTLRNRLERWGAARAVRAKTGTLRSAVALSGYVLEPDGGAIAFALVANGVQSHIGPARERMDDVVDVLASEADVNAGARP